MQAIVYHNARAFDQSENQSYYFELADAIDTGSQITIPRSQLVPVAEVENCVMLHDAYLKTQLSESSSQGDGVKLLVDSVQRSTLLGDVIEQDGKFYLVSISGFYPVTVSA